MRGLSTRGSISWAAPWWQGGNGYPDPRPGIRLCELWKPLPLQFAFSGPGIATGKSGAKAQCHLVFDRKFNMMETAADVTIEERSLGRGGKQVVKQMWWHCGVLVTSAVAEVQLQFTTMLVIAGRGQRRGFQRHPALSGSRHRLAS